MPETETEFNRRQEERKRWIDEASYVELLERWRNAAIGDPFFAGELGAYFSEVMARRRKEVGDAGHTQASKAIGWERT